MILILPNFYLFKGVNNNSNIGEKDYLTNHMFRISRYYSRHRKYGSTITRRQRFKDNWLYRILFKKTVSQEKRTLTITIVNKAIVLWPEVFDGCTVKKSSNKWKNYGNFIIIFRNPTDRPWQSRQRFKDNWLYRILFKKTVSQEKRTLTITWSFQLCCKSRVIGPFLCYLSY
jgi:hypothetical protein